MDQPQHVQTPVASDQSAYSEGVFGTRSTTNSPAERAGQKMLNIWDTPVTWFRERVVLPLRPANPPKYYHQKFRRVATVDECYWDDVVCIYEAHEQYKRDRKIDGRIVDILRMRWIDCLRYHGHSQAERCEDLHKVFIENETNWFVKYGDVCMYTNCSAAYYKQVHRLIWERRQAEKAQRQTKQQ